MNQSKYTDIQQACIERAVKDGYDPETFRVGHLHGKDAILLMMNLRTYHGIPTVSRVSKRTVSTMISNLVARCYDGKSLDEIVKSTTEILGERVMIYEKIKLEHDNRPSSEKHILSFDSKYSLPSYISTDIEIDDPKYVKYSNAFKHINGDRPRSRRQILEFIESRVGNVTDLDSAITYLVLVGLV